MIEGTNTNRIMPPQTLSEDSDTEYLFDFRIDREEDLEAIVAKEGKETQIIDHHYVLIDPDSIGNENGGTLKIGSGVAQAYAGWLLYIKGVGTFEQGVNVSNQANWKPEVYELALDDLTKQTIDLRERVSRALVNPVGKEPDEEVMLPAPLYKMEDGSIVPNDEIRQGYDGMDDKCLVKQSIPWSPGDAYVPNPGDPGLIFSLLSTEAVRYRSTLNIDPYTSDEAIYFRDMEGPEWGEYCVSVYLNLVLMVKDTDDTPPTEDTEHHGTLRMSISGSEEDILTESLDLYVKASSSGTNLRLPLLSFEFGAKLSELGYSASDGRHYLNTGVYLEGFPHELTMRVEGNIRVELLTSL